MNIQHFYQKISSQFKSAKIPFSENETREIFCRILKKDWAFILTHPEKRLTQQQKNKINTIVKKRLTGKPLAYILGCKNFYGLDFKINKNVLIPRPETELMVEKVLELLHSLLCKKSKNYKLRTKNFCIDVGTGSGCIPISIIKNLEKIENRKSKINFFGFDISQKALTIAKKNIAHHNLKNKILLKKSDLLKNLINKNSKFIENWKLEIENSNILILANLPYLSQKIYNHCPKSVKNYEPKLALKAGRDGLNLYRKLLDQIKTLQANLSFPLDKKESKKFLNNPRNYKLKTTNHLIVAFFEISPEQKNIIKKEILKRFLATDVKFYKDLSRKWRLAKIIF